MTPGELFRKLAALGLTTDQIGGVMDIFDADAETRKSKARARVQKWRDKNKDVTSRNVTETQHSVTKRLTRAEDNSLTLEITGKKEVSASPTATKRASRLPADWSLPDEWLAEAVKAGMSRDRALSEAERMKNWSLSSKAGSKLDWLAAWRNWYRDKIDQPSPRSQAQAPPPPRVVHGVTAALARRYQRQESHEQNPEIGSRDEDAQRIPADDRQLRLVAGHIRAAVGGGFDRSG